MTKALNETRVLLTNVRLSFPHLFEAHKFSENQEAKYSAVFVIPKDDEETVKVVKAAIKAAMQKGEEGVLHGKNPKTLRNPLRDGDVAREGDDVYKNAYFISATSKRPPQVVDRYLDPKTQKPIPLTEEEVYPGCYVSASVNFYPYSVSGNSGIAAGLGNVQKYKDGEPLSGAASAEDEFTFEEAKEADLDDDWMN